MRESCPQYTTWPCVRKADPTTLRWSILFSDAMRAILHTRTRITGDKRKLLNA